MECNSYTQTGNKCRRKTTLDSQYCFQHIKNPIVEEKKYNEILCSGKTKKGKNCTNLAIPGKIYCGIHDKKSTNDKENSDSKEPQKRKCNSDTKSGGECSNYAMTGKEYCFAHLKNPIPKTNNYWSNYSKNSNTNNSSLHRCCHYYSPGVQCCMLTSGPNEYCSIHKPVQFYLFNNSKLDCKFVLLTIDKQKKLSEAMKNYNISPQHINLNDIKKIYHQRAMKNHPDKGGNSEIFKQDLHDKELLEEFLS